MDDIFAFIGGLYLGIHYTRTKKIEYVFKIQWKEQPVLFGIIILLFWFFALDRFYDTLDLFGLSPISGRPLQLLDIITFFAIFFVATIASIFTKQVEIRKKIYTWQDRPLTRSSILVICLLLTSIFVRELLEFFAIV
ncbi:hypothetical protein [uncultured Fibrobacter sp.]|uniref:hypothetical protein n=1 Tax=uncultured Fibrobacter sp. TaxID=261512 RepID=UPI0025CBC263|nr:hypothetical protein [uncultured Fibrobacter sp.]